MTNMNEFVNTVDVLSTKSHWTLFLFMFAGWILVSVFSIRYMVTKRDESNEKLLASEQEKVDLIRKMSEERDLLHKSHADKMENLVRDLVSVQHQMIAALDRLEKAVLK